MGNKFEYVSKSEKMFNLPTRSTVHSAGYDFHSPKHFKLNPGETIKLSLEVRAKIKDGEFLAIVPRSSIGFKYHLVLDNTVGIIDKDYYYSDNEGEIFAKLTNMGDKELEVHTNDRLLQGIFIKYDITDDDETVTIRNGGIGSTGE